jgi:hypothetical protein
MTERRLARSSTAKVVIIAVLIGGTALAFWLIFYTASKIVLYYQRVAVARDERGTTDAEIWDQ